MAENSFGEVSNMRPFSDHILNSSSRLRIFDLTTDPREFVWHQDLNDRWIKVVGGEGWKFQFDNELPFDINKDDVFHVPKMVYHRIIPGKTSLRIKIDEMVETDLQLTAV